MGDLAVRVSRVIGADGDRRERHAFPDLAGHLAMAVCTTHVALTDDLGPDDPAVPMCPLCAVFLMADGLDGLDLGDWKAL